MVLADSKLKEEQEQERRAAEKKAKENADAQGEGDIFLFLTLSKYNRASFSLIYLLLLHARPLAEVVYLVDLSCRKMVQVQT